MEWYNLQGKKYFGVKKTFLGSFNCEIYLLFNVCYCLPCFYFMLYCDRSMGRVKNIEEQDAVEEQDSLQVSPLKRPLGSFLIYQ